MPEKNTKTESTLYPNKIKYFKEICRKCFGFGYSTIVEIHPSLLLHVSYFIIIIINTCNFNKNNSHNLLLTVTGNRCLVYRDVTSSVREHRFLLHPNYFLCFVSSLV